MTSYRIYEKSIKSFAMVNRLFKSNNLSKPSPNCSQAIKQHQIRILQHKFKTRRFQQTRLNRVTC